MNYYYDNETKEFLFDNHEKIEDYPSTEIDIHFNLSDDKNQIFDGKKWQIVHDYRKKYVYKKDGTRIYKKLGEKIEEDELILQENIFKKTKTYDKKNEIKFKINGFLAKTDKYFSGHPPQYKGDIEKLKAYREYLYSFTETEKWWEKELVSIEEWK